MNECHNQYFWIQTNNSNNSVSHKCQFICVCCYSSKLVQTVKVFSHHLSFHCGFWVFTFCLEPFLFTIVDRIPFTLITNFHFNILSVSLWHHICIFIDIYNTKRFSKFSIFNRTFMLFSNTKDILLFIFFCLNFKENRFALRSTSQNTIE